MATNEKVTFNRLITDKAEGLLEDSKELMHDKFEKLGAKIDYVKTEDDE